MSDLESLDKKVDELKSDIVEIKTALKYNGMGLIPSFEKHCLENQAFFQSHLEQEREFKKDYFTFKRWVISIFAFLAGSGVISISVIKALEVLAR